MGYEIDFLQVGNGETSGDCIALRFGDLHSGDPNKQWVIIIDGGFKESGENLVQLIADKYHTDYADLVVATHLDRDHIGGLTPVVEGMRVEKMLMQRPWLHTVSDGGSTKEAQAARKSYDQAADLETLATRKGIEIVEPFTGDEIRFSDFAFMRVLGPSAAYYEELLKEFDHNKSALAKLMGSLGAPVTAAVEALKRIQETIDPSTETLDHVHKNTSPENNSSAILYFDLGGHKLLFTGDAGVVALHQAADYAEVAGLDLTDLKFLDIPHHGSKHNLDSAFLDRVGTKTAFISATKDSKKHPSPRVINALVRRGVRVFTTEASNMWHHHDAPLRDNYSSVEPQELNTDFEDDDE